MLLSVLSFSFFATGFPIDSSYDPFFGAWGGEEEQLFADTGTGGGDVEGSNNDIDEDFVARNGRRPAPYTTTSPDTQISTGRPPTGQSLSVSSPTSSTLHLHSQDEAQNTQPAIPYYVDTKTANRVAGSNEEVANETAAALFHTPISTPRDALHLLLEASGRSESIQRQSSGGEDYHKTSTAPKAEANERGSFTRPRPAASLRYQRENIDPAIANSIGYQYLPDSPDVAAAVRAWSRLRFVRAGWFTAREAISYID
ncbi:MAG: hypothetical protein Q9181_001829 [Wetmoreana brouardii]